MTSSEKELGVAISVVMSVYNSEKYLGDAIESILNQSFVHFEFIIINDGSTDNSLSIIESYMECDDRIVLITQENKGLPYSLNEGIAISKGKYIARMDADDISLPERLEIQCNLLDSRPEIGVCGTLAYSFNDTTTKTKLINHPREHEDLKVRLLFSVCFVHPTVMMRKAVLNKLSHIYNLEYNNSQDYELWSRLVELTEFYNLQNPLLLYRTNQNGISADTNKNGLKLRFPLVSEIQIKQLKNLDISLDHADSILHYKLALNIEMKNIESSNDYVRSHLCRLVMANKNANIFDRKSFFLFLARKFSIFITLRGKKLKRIDLMYLFDSMFLVGLFLVLKEKITIKLRQSCTKKITKIRG